MNLPLVLLLAGFGENVSRILYDKASRRVSIPTRCARPQEGCCRLEVLLFYDTSCGVHQDEPLFQLCVFSSFVFVDASSRSIPDWTATCAVLRISQWEREDMHASHQLPEEFWNIVADHMSLRHWAMASGTCRTTVSVRVRAVNMLDDVLEEGPPPKLPVRSTQLFPV